VRLSLRLGLEGCLAPWAGAPLLGVSPLQLVEPQRAIDARAAGAPPPPNAPPAWRGAFAAEVLPRFAPCAVHARVEIENVYVGGAPGGGAAGGIDTAAQRAAPYVIPFTDLLLAQPLSASAFFCAWPTLRACASVAARAATRGNAGAAAAAASAAAAVATDASPLAALIAGADACPASLARITAADAPGAPGAGVAAYAARTWSGESLLLLITSAPRGRAVLEARSASAALPAALAADAAAWVEQLSRGACELAPDGDAAVDDADEEARRAGDESDDDAEWTGRVPAAAPAMDPRVEAAAGW
jgi:hypothetical protein